MGVFTLFTKFIRMADKQYIANNVGSIHHRETSHPLFNEGSICITNWKIFALSLCVIITFCAESIFKKSVSSLFYNYRWFILVQLNMLSLLFYLFIIFIRKMAEFHKKRKQQKHQKLESIL